MNEIDFGLKKTIETACSLKEMNDNVTKVEVIWFWVMMPSWCDVNKHGGYGVICKFEFEWYESKDRMGR